MNLNLNRRNHQKELQACGNMKWTYLDAGMIQLMAFVNKVTNIWVS